jgi:hypothetical protein
MTKNKEKCLCFRPSIMMVIVFLLITFSNASFISNNTVNSSVSTISSATTPIPVVYRAIVFIVLVVILIVLVLKALGFLLKALLVLVLLYIIVTLIIGVATTGTLTLHYTISYAQSIINLFVKGYTTANTISNNVNI